MRPMSAAMIGETKAHGAVMATRPASMPLAIIPGSGLPVRLGDPQHRDDGTEGAGDRRVGGDDGELHVGGGERRRGVEAEPAEQEDERAEHGHRDVVAGERARLAVGAVLADAWPEHERAGERGDAADGVHDTGAGEVDVAGTEAHRVPGLRQPAATPRPGGEQRVVEGAAEEAPDDEAAPLPPLGHRPRGDRGHGVHERDHVEEQGDDAGVDAAAGQGPAALEQEDPVVAEPISGLPTGAPRPPKYPVMSRALSDSGKPMRKKPTKPRPKMAKFVLTTWAACLARQKPVSTRANPACMKMTRIAPITTHSMLIWPAEGHHLLGLGDQHRYAQQFHLLPPHGPRAGRSGALRRQVRTSRFGRIAEMFPEC